MRSFRMTLYLGSRWIGVMRRPSRWSKLWELPYCFPTFSTNLRNSGLDFFSLCSREFPFSYVFPYSVYDLKNCI